MSDPAARQSPADIYIAALRAQRDTLEIQNAGLRFQLAAAQAEAAALKEQLQEWEDRDRVIAEREDMGYEEPA